MLQGCYKDVKTEEVENFFVLQWKKIREVQKRMKENAFIKLPRSLLNSQYFDDPRLFRFVVGLIAMARFVPEERRGTYVSTGQLLTTKKELMEKFDLPRSTFNRIFDKLILDGIISSEAVNRYDILITVHIAPTTIAASTMLKKQAGLL